MELHLLLEHLFFDSAFHSAHTAITHLVSILVPELVRLFVARIWVKCPSERELELDWLGVCAFTCRLLR